jgi:adenylate cyclase
MLGQLVPCGGGPPIPLLKPRLLLGRHPSCDVPLSLPTISSRHCRLDFRDGFWHLQDLGSSNGTRVNGTPCTTRWLVTGDELTLSHYRFRIVYTTPPGRIPPTEAGPIAEKQAPQRPAPPAASSARSHISIHSEPLGKLVPCGGGDPILLRKPRVVIGRHTDCDVVLRYSIVSGRHCQLDLENGRWRVRDLGSRNGIRVDGTSCQEHDLPPGSILSIAIMRYRVHYDLPHAEPAPRGLFGQGLLEQAGLARFAAPDSEDRRDPPPARSNPDTP